jgi:hypothetical protein
MDIDGANFLRIVILGYLTVAIVWTFILLVNSLQDTEKRK